jgi:tetratricopeptide (TPR) repeat protein
MPATHDDPLIQTRLLQAKAQLVAGRLRDASVATLALIREYPADPRPWALMGSVHLRGDRPDLALVCLEHAVGRAPEDAALRIRQGQCLARLGRRREALATAAAADAMPTPTAALADGLGTLYSHCDEPGRALPHYLRAVAMAPAVPAYLYNLATAQRMLGDLAGAEDSLDRVIAASPSDHAAYLTRADLRRQTRDRNHVAALQARLAATDLDRAGEITLCFALAKELEDLGRHAESFTHLQRGCSLQRASTPYDVGTDVATMDQIVARHDAAALRAGPPGDPSEEPIFVIGLPRSGTTLVESILAAHDDVLAPGELQAFPQACIEAVGALAGGNPGKLEFVQRALEVDPAALGRRYLEATRPQTGSRPRFVDKLPLNYLYAGLIHRALPRARIVALERDPMDSCYAMYKTLFTSAYPFSYDLDDLGRYHLAWQRLMRHWREVLGPALLVVRYEDLVADQEGVSRRLLEHCGLAWQPACLEFHRRSGAVATASAAQVRQPLYSTSVGRWRHYEAELAPLARRLAASS